MSNKDCAAACMACGESCPQPAGTVVYVCPHFHKRGTPYVPPKSKKKRH